MRNHRAALAHLAFVERRRVDRDQKFGAQLDQLVGRIVCVETFAPESFVVPEVFTNCDAEFFVVELKQMSFGSGLEVARIVEHVVLGQQRFVCKAEQFLITNDGGGVVETPSGC